ncbi:hypothetical protein J2Z60_002146 [Lactobacillus colini]|uniref:DNA primase n=1 Tax=Lactobacillus colini TaxID=1819254 RepID=A0ABS4MGY0_9LACO|nr:bifunctional DNA primase/polymerase [Lactobacillus colini]MBP2058955.1 hypothetical protein [Lactobacillus colini]
MNNNLNAAIQLAKNGFSVVPIIPDTKRPAIKHANQEPLTIDEIRELWTEYPNYGIAIKTTDFFCIDIDTPQHSGTTKIDGTKSLRKYFNDILLPETLTALTPSGGIHFYYKKIDGKPNKSLAGVFPGIDLQADKNSISIIPPTTRNGIPYVWKPNVKTITKPPIELINMLQKQLTPQKYKIFSNFASPNNSSPKSYMANLLEEMVTPQVKGQRNTYLTHIVGKLLVSGITTKTAYQYTNFANSNFVEPLPLKEVNQIFTSIFYKEMRKQNKHNG